MESNANHQPALEKRRVLLGMPGYSGITSGASQSFWVCTSGRTRIGGKAVTLEVDRQYQGGSLLAMCFNRLWCWALNDSHKGGKVDYFAMLHSDVEPEVYWLDKLIAEMERCDYDVLSAVVPLKDPNGITSTALARPDGDPWRPLCRLTMKEVYDLPETFDESHTGHPLLLNTGCWVCRFENVSQHGMHFTINDRIIFDKKADEFVAEVESEDWNFSRQCNAAGLKLGATRKIGLHHVGNAHFSNQAAWGEQYFDSALVRQSQVKPQPAKEYVFPHYVDGWLLPEEGAALSELSRGKRVLEIGSYCGKSTICIAQTAEHVVAVDPHDGRGTFRPRETRQEMLKNLRDFGLADKVTIVHPDEFVPEEWGPFDVGFVDGAHDYGSVQQDNDKLRRCLNPDGIIAFHDYRVKPGDVDSRWDPGVTQSVDELISDGGELLAIHGTIAVVRPPGNFFNSALRTPNSELNKLEV